ncbi:MAG: hypothetical protein ACLFV2_03735 [Desulfurivibrionaceae bacterium]
MTDWIKTSHTLAVMLLILLMSATTALPAGVHLEFCFGSDGHFDLKTETCLPTMAGGQVRDEAIADHAHHEDCLDVAVGCTSSEHLFRSTATISALKDKINNPPLWIRKYYPTEFLYKPVQASIRTTHLNNGGVSPQPHLVSLHTIVLLI